MSIFQAASIANSALHLASRALQANAHNVANMNTDGFKSHHIVALEDSSGGVREHLAKSTTPGPTVFEAGELRELSNTDLIQETVDRAIITATYKANMSVLRTAFQMSGEILDLVA
jgi:flagellar hook protein FlgE